MSRPWALVLSLAIVTLMILGGVAALPAGTAAAASVTPVATNHLASSAAASGVDPHWYNVTANLSAHSSGSIPAVSFGSNLADDPLLSELVLFNGCSATLCPTNDTWVYDGTSGENITGTLTQAPSARDGAGMAYDPAFHGIILFGGVDLAGNVLNDTWLFTSSGWNNITATVGTPQFENIPGEPLNGSYGGMAYDPGLGGIVAVDGCALEDCVSGSEYGITLLLTGTGWTYYSDGPGTDSNATYLSYNSLVYDYADGYLVSYGGFDYYANARVNYTFTMNASGNWVNITNDNPGCGNLPVRNEGPWVPPALRASWGVVGGR